MDERLESEREFQGALTCEDYLAGYKDQQHNLGHLHAVDQTREELRLILQSNAVVSNGCECGSLLSKIASENRHGRKGARCLRCRKRCVLQMTALPA